MKFLLLLILSITIFKPHTVFGQAKLPTGLYKLNENGDYTLTLNRKTYHTDAKPIALLKDITNISLSHDPILKSYYNLNIELDTEATQAMKNIFVMYNQTVYIGLIISGKLVLAPRLSSPITTGKVNIGNKSKPELEQIADRLKAEKGKK